jgi:hypothetical protein
MNFKFIRAPKSLNKLHVKAIVGLFSILHNIKIQDYEITLDFRKSPAAPKFPGPFGGFHGLLNKQKKQIYVELRSFIEYKHGDTNSTIHCILHELVHVRDLLEHRLVVHKDGIEIYYKNKFHTRCPFSFDIFQRIYALDKKLAQDYNIHALPWEKEAYELPKQFMGKEIYEH